MGAVINRGRWQLGRREPVFSDSGALRNHQPPPQRYIDKNGTCHKMTLSTVSTVPFKAARFTRISSSMLFKNWTQMINYLWTRGAVANLRRNSLSRRP